MPDQLGSLRVEERRGVLLLNKFIFAFYFKFKKNLLFKYVFSGSYVHNCIDVQPSLYLCDYC